MVSEPLLRPAILEILQELIQTPSVNPSLVPNEAHGKKASAKVALEWLAANGVKSWLEEAAPIRANAVGEFGASNGPTLVFCAHLDTVGRAGMTIPPFEPSLEGHRVYGRGSYDMKGSAAAVMAAVAALGREEFPSWRMKNSPASVHRTSRNATNRRLCSSMPRQVGSYDYFRLAD